MAEKVSKTKIYHEILSKKEKLTVLKQKEFNFEFPKKAFDRICLFYGKLALNPISFVRFNKSTQKIEFQKLKTISHTLGEKEIGDILESSKSFAIIPKYYHDKYDLSKISQISPKIKNNIMKDIVKKAGLQWDLLLDFCEIQIISTEYHETLKTTISYEIVENVFKNIPLLNISFINGQKVDCTFYSYKKILEKCGIRLEKMIPLLKHEIKEFDRMELFHQINPLYEKVKVRELKEKIKHGDLKDQNVDIYHGANTCHRYKKIPFDNIVMVEKEVSDLLKDLNNKVDEQKNKIKKYYENTDNHIYEIKDKNNKNIFIRKQILDEILSSPEEGFDEYKIKDINENEIIISKKDLSNYKNSPPYIKINNKNSPNDFIFIEIENIKKILDKFSNVKKEDTLKGKNKNIETTEQKWMIMDIECNDLPKLDETNPLYSIPEKEILFEKTKKNLLDELKEENKDIILYHKKNKFISSNSINEIKERDKNIKNKNIKYKLKNQINENENIILEYNDIFSEENSPEFILINNEDNPSENIVINKKDLLKELNIWNNINNTIKIKNEINNNEIEINPHKIKIIKLKKEQIPENYESIQEQIKKSITPENTIIKSGDKFIKKLIVQKIKDHNESEYDIYYIKDINGKKIKISKKQLMEENEDPSLQFISVSTKEEPDKKIIISTQELYKEIEKDPMDDVISINDKDGNNYKIKKTSIKINPLEVEEIDFDGQPNKIKNDIIKGIKDYYYLYKDKDNKPHYIRGDTLKLIKNYKSKYPIENFEIEDEKGNRFIIPKEDALKLIDNPKEKKYINLYDEESKDEHIIADLEMFKNNDGDIDELMQVNEDGKKIKLKNIKATKLKEINSLSEQSEEKLFEYINDLIQKIQKNNPSSDIYQIKDIENKDVYIYEDTLNKIEENKADPEKTKYKAYSPKKEEIICRKNISKISPNKYIKILDPNIIIDQNALLNSLKNYKLGSKSIRIKDSEGVETDIDPLKIKIYEASQDETDIVKILPDDFSDINEKLLLDIIPQNKLIIINDINNSPIIIKKKERDNVVKYPKTNFDIFSLYDKNGNKIKISRKILEENANDENCEFIEIIDNTNDENKNEIILVKDLEEALKDKENEDFEVKNNEGKKIKLNKKKITIVKQNNKYIDIPEQGEEIKNKLLSEINDSFIKLKDSKTNKDILLRNSQLNEIISHKQQTPFINYEVLNDKNEKVYTTKDICNQIISDPNIEKLIVCYEENNKDKEYLVPIEKIQNSNLDGDDEFDLGDNQKIIFKNLKIKKLPLPPKLGEQPEEEKMKEIINLINIINSDNLIKNYKTKDIDKKTCFISNNYIYPLQSESKNEAKNTNYKIIDSLGNKIVINKEIIEKDNKPGKYIIVKNKKDENKKYLVDSNNLLNSLKKFKSTDDEIIITNSMDNKNIKLSPREIEIVSPNNDYPLQKINPENIEGKKGMRDRLRLRSMPMRLQDSEKKTFIIRRAIIYRKNDKGKH